MSARISSAKRRRTRLRSRGSVRRQMPCSKVLRALSTAASTSARPQRATAQMTSPSIGLMSLNTRPSRAEA